MMHTYIHAYMHACIQTEASPHIQRFFPARFLSHLYIAYKDRSAYIFLYFLCIGMFLFLCLTCISRTRTGQHIFFCIFCAWECFIFCVSSVYRAQGEVGVCLFYLFCVWECFVYESVLCLTCISRTRTGQRMLFVSVLCSAYHTYIHM